MRILLLCIDILIVEEICNIIKIIAEIILCGITGGCAILGVSYLKKLKEKKQEALVGYWIQLGTQIIMINSRIKSFPGILSTLCDDDSVNKLLVDKIEEEFYLIVKDTLCFIKDHDNQIPLVPGWTENYKTFICFLNDFTQYHHKSDDGKPYFYKFLTADELNTYKNEQIECMEQLIEIINNELKRIENLT